MGRVDLRAPVDAGPVEERRVDDLSIGDYLAFEYGTDTAPMGIGMTPVRTEHRARPLPLDGCMWGRVAGISPQLWRSFPVVTESRVVWVLCEFSDQSSIITGIPHRAMILMRRSPL